MLITVDIDMLIDGVLIGVTFLAEAVADVIVAIALAIELLFPGVTGVVALPVETSTLRKLAVPATFGTSLTIGVTVLKGVSGAPIAVVSALGVVSRHGGTARESSDGAGDARVDDAVLRRLLSIFLLDMVG